MAMIVSLIIGFINIVVGLRFVFRLLGADPASSLVAWIYNVSNPLVAPFSGIFGQPATVTGVNGGVFEWFSLLALLVYAFIGWIIVRMVAAPFHHHHGV